MTALGAVRNVAVFGSLTYAFGHAEVPLAGQALDTLRQGQAVADTLQAMIDGGPAVSNFLVRKLDENFDNVATTGSVDVEFDLAD